MLQCFFAADSLGRIECQELAQQVKRQGVGLREKLLERYSRLDRQRSNVAIGTESVSRFRHGSGARRLTLALVDSLHALECPPSVFRVDSGSDSIGRHSRAP